MKKRSKGGPSWQELIPLSSVNLILGHKGKGKSALAYYLLEKLAPTYDLQAVVADFPLQEKSLLPDSFVILPLNIALHTPNAIILVDEGTTALPAGGKLDEMVKACSSISRQRRQIIILVYHSSRDIGSKALRGMDAIILKEPSSRQIQFGSKDPWFRSLLLEAKEEFSQLHAKSQCRWSFVNTDEPDFSGMVSNPLPTFWSPELSTVWGRQTFPLIGNEEQVVTSAQLTERELQYLVDTTPADSLTRGEGLKCSLCSASSTEETIFYCNTCLSCYVKWIRQAYDGDRGKVLRIRSLLSRSGAAHSSFSSLGKA